VPSPEPQEIVPSDAIRDLLADGVCVICSGGGGVPVVRSRGGALSGIDAVIDKDLAAALLAAEVSADALLILTDVPKAYIHYNTPEQKALDRVTMSEMEAYAAAGHFKAGSMGPKVDACLRFVRRGGEAVIASLTHVVQALDGDAGTRIVPDAAATRKPAPKAAAKPSRKAARAKPGTAGAGGGGRPKKPAPKAKKPAPRAKKPAPRAKKPAPQAKAPAAKSPGADVIDISSARRRAAGGAS
jgi:hypothetical protein